MITIKIPPHQQAALLRALDPKRVAAAEAQALNRTRNNTQTTGLKAVAREMGVKVSQLRKRGRPKDRSLATSARKAGKFGAVTKGRNATRRRLETSIVGRGRPFNANRWDGADVTVAGRTVATMHSAYGRRQIAKRTWRLKNGAIVHRKGNSFEGVFGPGVGQMMERKRVLRLMERTVLERFPQHFKSAVEFLFSPAGRSRVR